jgi:Tetrahydromethanopterin S-methyltransferase, subunit H
MFHYRKEQKIISIGKFVMGGQPGELPTTLFGAIFSGKNIENRSKKGPGSCCRVCANRFEAFR